MVDVTLGVVRAGSRSPLGWNDEGGAYLGQWTDSGMTRQSRTDSQMVWQSPSAIPVGGMTYEAHAWFPLTATGRVGQLSIAMPTLTTPGVESVPSVAAAIFNGRPWDPTTVRTEEWTTVGEGTGTHVTPEFEIPDNPWAIVALRSRVLGGMVLPPAEYVDPWGQQVARSAATDMPGFDADVDYMLARFRYLPRDFLYQPQDATGRIFQVMFAYPNTRSGVTLHLPACSPDLHNNPSQVSGGQFRWAVNQVRFPAAVYGEWGTNVAPALQVDLYPEDVQVSLQAKPPAGMRASKTGVYLSRVPQWTHQRVPEPVSAAQIVQDFPGAGVTLLVDGGDGFHLDTGAGGRAHAPYRVGTPVDGAPGIMLRQGPLAVVIFPERT
jgi:hypothetical protein